MLHRIRPSTNPIDGASQLLCTILHDRLHDGTGQSEVQYLGLTVDTRLAASLRVAYRETRRYAAVEMGKAGDWAADWWMAVARLVRARRRLRGGSARVFS